MNLFVISSFPEGVRWSAFEDHCHRKTLEREREHQPDVVESLPRGIHCFREPAEIRGASVLQKLFVHCHSYHVAIVVVVVADIVVVAAAALLWVVVC